MKESRKIYSQRIGKGIPVLLIHGYFVDHRLMSGSFEPIFLKLEEKGIHYQRHYIDLPGMGKTPGGETNESSDRMLEAVQEYIDEYIGDHSFLVCGQSYGGYLALGLMNTRREQIIGSHLLCPVVIPESQERELPDFQVIEKEDLSCFSKEIGHTKFEKLFTVQTEVTWKRYKSEMLPGTKLADLKTLFSMKNSGSYRFSKITFEEWDKPILMLLGRYDFAVGYKDQLKLMDKLPKASYYIGQRSGHNLHIEEEFVFKSLSEQWLMQVEKTCVSE